MKETLKELVEAVEWGDLEYNEAFNRLAELEEKYKDDPEALQMIDRVKEMIEDMLDSEIEEMWGEEEFEDEDWEEE